MRQLTLVVNCTDRKSLRPDPELQVRSLGSGDDGARFGEWSTRLAASTTHVDLQSLYRGEAWVQAVGLARDATTAGFEVTLCIASAGLGLRRGTSVGPAYSATFAAGQADTVSAGTAGIQAWWRRLEALPSSLDLAEVQGRHTLLVLSANYARALEDDLAALGERGGDILLVGGARDIPGLPRLASDRALRSELGGTASSLNLRMARAWLTSRKSADLYDVTDEARWQSWAASVRLEERYDRQPAPDSELMTVIEALIAADSTLSASRALRHLRDAGVACEQKRFGRLFNAVRGGER